jgi:putative NIF3 family GTP cyclohydrolase 1 type 2
MNIHSRRKFISTISLATGAAAFLPTNLQASDKSPEVWTVGKVMDLFIAGVPGAPFPKTVDTLKSGNRDIEVTGIVTTMFANLTVIREAIARKANFIIAHEPTFYNHLDETDWLKNDDVYEYKANLLKEHNIAVWRNHDYIHSLKEDGVLKGVVKQLGWEGTSLPESDRLFNRPAVSLRQLIGELKQRLGISTVRYIGDPGQRCSRVLLMPGAAGGKAQIGAIGRSKPDVILCGEIAEWETAEYVRDAHIKGNKLSLVLLGHIASEEPGSEFMKEWLKEHVPGVAVAHVPAGGALSFM